MKSGYNLSDVNGVTHKVTHERFDRLEVSKVSLMPEGLTAGLSGQEYADLIAFLMDQKTTGLAALAAKDQPVEIRVLKRPIQLTPFHEPGLAFIGPVWMSLLPGQDTYEEIDIIRKGENYGWNVYEAYDEFSEKYRQPIQVFTPPLFAYSRKLGTSITGGHVYRGNPDSPLYGFYICGDHESRRIFAMSQKHGKLDEVYELGFSSQRISSFGVDLAGEIYLVGYQGTIFHLDLSRNSVELK